MFTRILSIVFIISFLTPVSFPPSHLLSYQKPVEYRIVCRAERLFNLDDEWTSSCLTIQWDKYALRFVQVKDITEPTNG